MKHQPVANDGESPLQRTGVRTGNVTSCIIGELAVLQFNLLTSKWNDCFMVCVDSIDPSLNVFCNFPTVPLITGSKLIRQFGVSNGHNTGLTRNDGSAWPEFGNRGVRINCAISGLDGLTISGNEQRGSGEKKSKRGLWIPHAQRTLTHHR